MPDNRPQPTISSINVYYTYILRWLGKRCFLESARKSFFSMINWQNTGIYHNRSLSSPQCPFIPFTALRISSLRTISSSLKCRHSSNPIFSYSIHLYSLCVTPFISIIPTSQSFIAVKQISHVGLEHW